MAAMNSLLFLLTTMAPNMEPPGNYPATQTPEWLKAAMSRYEVNVARLTQQNCGLGTAFRCNSHCQRNCSNYDKDIACQRICVLGCVCIDPFIRGPDGSCIMHYECPTDAVTPGTSEEVEDVRCRPDEVMSNHAPCELNCKNYDKSLVCSEEFTYGCICQYPLIRGNDGTCILPELCPKGERNPEGTFAELKAPPICEADEIASHYAHCPVTCENYSMRRHCSWRDDQGCVCKSPLVRAPDDKCVSRDRCSEYGYDPEDVQEENNGTRCPPYEMMSDYAYCQVTCDNYDVGMHCLTPGVPDCVCAYPMVRGPNGTCISSEQCPNSDRIPQDLPKELDAISCKPDEVLTNFVHCQLNCDNYDAQIYCPWFEKRGCQCKYPLVRGPNGDCIDSDQCPKIHYNPPVTPQGHDGISCHQPDEHLSNAAHCYLHCSNYDAQIYCPWFENLGCVCNYPLVRGPDGTCIESTSCPKRRRNPPDTPIEPSDLHCQPDEVMSNSAHCELDCKNFDKPNYCPRNDVRGCVCKFPLVRGPSGTCIPPKQCSSIEHSPLDSPCLDYRECDNNTDVNHDDENNTAGEYNYKKCSGGISDPFEMLCEGPNEVYKSCSSQCPDDCKNYKNKLRVCKKICLPFPKCECKDGYVRGPDRKCIEPEQCPNLKISTDVCPENEVYKVCGTACQKDCRNYNINTPCEFKCEPGCFCQEPMIRGPDGKCIPKEECPGKLNESRQPRRNWNVGYFSDMPNITCKENEEFSICAPLCPTTCSNFQEAKLCKDICVPGCKCKHRHVQAKNGTCIELEQCEEF